MIQPKQLKWELCDIQITFLFFLLIEYFNESFMKLRLFSI